ncbi:MAG: diguanylate cyclase [Deltaproteobacteria bacterium]|nr:MAG: diguanylate cyclase [Deltaproteobacteria bacterium]
MDGHLTGDAVLQEVARRLAASVREHDGCGRFGATTRSRAPLASSQL